MPAFPASFTYGGRAYRGFPEPDFAVITRTPLCAGGKKEDCRIELAGPQNLTVAVDAAFYPAFGVYEWTLRFENRGAADTAELGELFACDMVFPGERPVLRGILGDHENQYRPYARDLTQEDVRFVSDSGRPTHVYFPYFNLEHGDGGTMLAIGWAGTWSARFERADGAIRYRARSVNDLALSLRPGESIGTALIVVAGYRMRDEHYATNFWRSWFIECNLPPADREGAPLRAFSTCCLAADTGRPNSDGSISEAHDTWRPSLDKMAEVGAQTDFRWFDAGWYPDPKGNTVESDWWGTVGAWVLDPVKWPGRTFRDSVEYAHRRGMKTLMWFEPERVTNPEALAARHGYDVRWAIRRPGDNTITNNLGDPDCLRWTADRIIRVLTENKVDMYREDNNGNPGPLWRDQDAKDGRRGMTECRFVAAHYALWDAIVDATARGGGCAFCDSCASGGGRNDLASLRRAVPLLRSDSDRTSTALRLSMTTAFNRFIPFCGANTKEKAGQLDATGLSDRYTWRASYLPILNVDSQFVRDPDQDFDMLRFGLEEWKRINRFLLADFYPLTPWHAPGDRAGFTAFAYYDEDALEGVLFAFRMEDCEQDALELSLPFAEPGARYRLVSADGLPEIAAADRVRLSLPEKRTALMYHILRA
ncbi:MAG: hypothetical protein GX558_12320 [Clostridiales bacterium]|nr:hypothetical protein [Clostridiales bacterium]